MILSIFTELIARFMSATDPNINEYLWTFTPRGTPTKKGLQSWLEAAKSIDSEAKKSPKIGG